MSQHYKGVFYKLQKTCRNYSILIQTPTLANEIVVLHILLYNNYILRFLCLFYV